ncbi:8705_t:CDS:2, partial [Racocetra persica]
MIKKRYRETNGRLKHPYQLMEKSKSDLLKETNRYKSFDDSTLRDVEAKTKVTPFLYRAVLTAALSGFAVGYDTGVISALMIILEKTHNLTKTEQTSFIGATTLGGAIGALVAGSLTMSLSSTITIMLISRLISGIASGIASMTAPVYIGEISPKYHRGQLVTFNVLLSNGATLFAVLSGMAFVSDGGWRWINAIASVPSLLQLFGLLYVPETPRFLVKKGDFENARNVLNIIYPDSSQEFLDKEIEDIHSVVSEDAKGSYAKLIQPPYLKPFLIVCGIVCSQELCGFDTFLYFSGIILNMAGFTDTGDTLKFSLIVFGGNFLVTVVTIYVVDPVGRRKLLLYTLLATIIGLVCLGISFIFVTGIFIKQNTCSDYVNNCAACLFDKRCIFNKQNRICVVLNNNSTRSNISCDSYNNRFFVL